MKTGSRTFYEQLGKQIREARTAAGLTQAELADYLNISRSSVANIEIGRQVLSAYDLMRIHGLLGLERLGPVPQDPNLAAILTDRQRLAEANQRLRARLNRARRYLTEDPNPAAELADEMEHDLGPVTEEESAALHEQWPPD